MSLAPLGLLPIRVHGRPPKTPTILGVRPLTAEEVSARAARVEGHAKSTLRRLSSRHRELARRIAAGASVQEAALATGLTPTRVSQLKADPTFMDLVEHVHLEVQGQFMGIHEKLAAVAEEGLDVLAERLEEAPEEFSVGEIITVVKMGADRTGHGPSRQETKNINFNFGDRLDEARRRVKDRPVIEGEVLEVNEVTK